MNDSDYPATWWAAMLVIAIFTIVILATTGAPYEHFR